MVYFQIFVACTIVDLIYSAIACVCRVLWLALTGLTNPPNAIVQYECLRHVAECTKKTDLDTLAAMKRFASVLLYCLSKNKSFTVSTE